MRQEVTQYDQPDAPGCDQYEGSFATEARSHQYNDDVKHTGRDFPICDRIGNENRKREGRRREGKQDGRGLTETMAKCGSFLAPGILL
jgi:hypothetical protein